MSTAELSPDELLAAEYALGLLEGEALLAARARYARDPEFAARVEWWETQLSPLLDEIGVMEPDAELWARIERALDDPVVSSEVVALRKRLRRWQFVSGIAMAASVAALMFAALPSLRAPVGAPSPTTAPMAQAPLVASIPIADTPLRLAVTYLPERRELLVSAAGLTADGVHDHELWLVPDRGELRSLGLVRPGEATRVALTRETAALIHPGSQMVLTREPLGGKPPADAAGPVVAQGSFTRT